MFRRQPDLLAATTFALATLLMVMWTGPGAGGTGYIFTGRGPGPAGAMAQAAQGAAAGTLAQVRKRGHLRCGVSQGLPGFSSTDDAGNWSGLDVDFCKAVAAAIFGDAGKVKFTPLSAKERFTALQSGEIDILSRNTTWTMARDTAQGMSFAGIIYYDGQAFMVKRGLGITSALELSGASVCTNTGTTTEMNVADFFRKHKMPYEIVPFEKSDEAAAAYDAGRCDAYTSDASGLAANRLKLKNPQDNIILPEIISKEPLGPVVRQGDVHWFNLVKWVLFALINAEELGVTKDNVAAMAASRSPQVRRLLGTEGRFGAKIGLGAGWALKAIAAVGHYGEIYERNVGKGSPLQIPRGLNRLWKDKGILYAPPIR